MHPSGACTAPGWSTRPNRWGIAVMTRYPIGLGMIYGEDTCQRVADLALAGDS